jgi:hypothetical protein
MTGLNFLRIPDDCAAAVLVFKSAFVVPRWDGLVESNSELEHRVWRRATVANCHLHNNNKVAFKFVVPSD